MREERSLKFKFESWPPIIGGIMKVKRANRLMSIIDEIWVIHLQKVDTLLMMVFRTNIFTLIPVIMVWYIYKYWFKMLKRWKFPPLIKARASSTNCTMGNLTWSRHTTYYIQSMLNLTRFISFYYTNPWPVRELYVCDAIMKKLGSSCYDQQCFYWLIMSSSGYNL